MPTSFAVEGLALEQRPGHGVEPAPVSAQELDGPFLLVAQDAGDLGVDHPGRVLRVVAGVHEVLAEEDHALGPPRHRPELLAHAPLADHLAGQLGVADEVVAGAGGQVAVHEQLGGAAAHPDGERVLDHSRG